MYREIEFRGQSINNNEWIYGYYVKDPKGEHRIYWKPFDDASSNTYHFVKPESIEQWTGLIDIEGKKVYENQTINAPSYNPSRMKLKFIEGGFCAVPLKDDNSFYPIDINHFYPSIGCQFKAEDDVV